MIDPIVSVIITTFKRSQSLSNAIESVLNQTYQNIELIIIDDNDTTSKEAKFVYNLVKEFKKKDDRIRYISMIHNSGACASRNRGISEAKGEFINFLDDDDIFFPNKIESQVKYFFKLPTDVAAVGCFAVIKDNEGNVIRYEKNTIRGDVFFPNLCQSICQTSIPLIKRDILLKCGGFEEIPSSQEHLMLANLFNISPYYDYIDEICVAINHHNGNRISNGKNKVKGAIMLEDKFQRFYHKLSEKEILELQLAMKKNIINAYTEVGCRKEPLSMLFKIRKRLSIKDLLKYFFKISLGKQNVQKINFFILKLKQH
ncbi:glycosyltransferase family 2 protein [Enterococcus cecorum]|uniref:glycosyltransferase family 2 protein n=1 Tax=Enterococcus cecorum TaxID=44008 RepID=UPI00148D885C|nr:glycosyltransferase family 2 protein [Enterococcus cecorum]